jgi:hypothetical protein
MAEHGANRDGVACVLGQQHFDFQRCPSAGQYADLPRIEPDETDPGAGYGHDPIRPAVSSRRRAVGVRVSDGRKVRGQRRREWKHDEKQSQSDG